MDLSSTLEQLATETQAVGATSRRAPRRLTGGQELQKAQREARETYNRLIAARKKIAELMPMHPHLTPIFNRLEHEVKLVTAEMTDDPLVRARAIAATYRN